MYWKTNLPDEEDESMDAERRRHPWRSQSRPEGVVVIGQVKEGDEVCRNVGESEDDIEEDELTQGDHPEGFLTSSITLYNIVHLDKLARLTVIWIWE